MTQQKEPTQEEPRRMDIATVSGDHEQVSDMAILLSDSGKKVKVYNGNVSTTLKPEREYTATHYDERSVIQRDDNNWVAVDVSDNSELFVAGN